MVGLHQALFHTPRMATALGEVPPQLVGLTTMLLVLERAVYDVGAFHRQPVHGT